MFKRKKHNLDHIRHFSNSSFIISLPSNLGFTGDLGDGGVSEVPGDVTLGLEAVVVGVAGSTNETVSIFDFSAACSISFGGASKLIFLKK